MKRFLLLLCAAGIGLSAAAAFAGEKTQSFPARKGGMLEVRVDGGNVTVKGWEKEEVFVRASSLSEEQLKNVTMSQGGGKVLVEFKSKSRDVEDMEFEISVPSSFSTEIRTAGGDMTFTGPLSGELRGSSAGGAITLDNLGGNVRMETAGGEIRAGDIAGDLTVRTAGGSIDVKNVTGTAEVSTAGGEISVASVGKSLRASTAGGDMTIGKVSGDVQASTAGGSIQVREGHGNVSLSTAGGNIDVRVAQGKVSANTSAGNIDLRDVEGAVSARSAAGDIRVRLDPSIGESSTMATSAGDIVLSVPENAKATIYARTRGPFGGWDEKDDTQIRSDFPVTRPGSGKHESQVEVTLNGGGHRISLETMIGTINIKKAK